MRRTALFVQATSDLCDRSPIFTPCLHAPFCPHPVPSPPEVKIKSVKTERQRIIAYLNKVSDAPLQTQRSQSLGAAAAGNVSSSVVDRVNEMQAAQTEAEYKRLEVIRRRQQSELQRMVEAEQKMIEVQNKIVAAEEYAAVLKVRDGKQPSWRRVHA